MNPQKRIVKSVKAGKKIINYIYLGKKKTATVWGFQSLGTTVDKMINLLL